MSEFILSQDAISFFMHSYFGVEKEELIDKRKKDCIIIKCAQRAYRDLNRTLRFNDNPSDKKLTKKEIEEIHKKFCDDICIEIKDSIMRLLQAESQEDFDKEHTRICDEIIIENAANRKREDGAYVLSEIKNKKDKPGREECRFYYGQAQKWLNMTLKYMWLIGLWQEELENKLSWLHVPVDSFIIEAVWHEGQPENGEEQLADSQFENWTIKLPCDENKRRLKYSDEKVVSWSKWSCKEYTKFQTSLRESPLLKQKYPIEWEGEAWLEIAKKRSNE